MSLLPVLGSILLAAVDIPSEMFCGFIKVQWSIIGKARNRAESWIQITCCSHYNSLVIFFFWEEGLTFSRKDIILATEYLVYCLSCRGAAFWTELSNALTCIFLVPGLVVSWI